MGPGGPRRDRVSRAPSRNQELVLGVLRAAPGRALSAYDILQRLASGGMRGPQTVYRALEALLRAGDIHRIESLNAFCACSHADHHHHGHAHRPAFAVCRDCGAVKEVEDDALTAVVGVVATRTGFTVRDRVLELVGSCPACQALEALPLGDRTV